MDHCSLSADALSVGLDGHGATAKLYINPKSYTPNIHLPDRLRPLFHLVFSRILALLQLAFFIKFSDGHLENSPSVRVMEAFLQELEFIEKSLSE